MWVELYLQQLASITLKCHFGFWGREGVMSLRVTPFAEVKPLFLNSEKLLGRSKPDDDSTGACPSPAKQLATRLLLGLFRETVKLYSSRRYLLAYLRAQ